MEFFDGGVVGGVIGILEVLEIFGFLLRAIFLHVSFCGQSCCRFIYFYHFFRLIVPHFSYFFRTESFHFTAFISKIKNPRILASWYNIGTIFFISFCETCILRVIYKFFIC
ncbi:hypothetical protein GLOIN_2v1615457 [Rhizophagus irregularis DAOM 181602=DAOM 197198]|uniref:Uncharacterized protein n=1 Tax=Rhizophagus irregularis (strain DAOM 181602 / DAOM 197198 / MUCL 43194) TaxID=747089 RepID=A0A2P4PYR5_RHIID|nr:hypothetical protein GLOIN_2v1615457 [Rhizophagus irregularis DAOM 181602=DAOM 197198]POG70510.1 hypothetical protein GLOIN_2v1615457 [Rhizophagus irregularis DAOM 181602=DAOM 197198]|eukprot:XP_025177376.1 hypothetical protein GLOIN_2v1615457 [Rhizophagus irregularis DAOM 181602=DAOM 197198]